MIVKKVHNQKNRINLAGIFLLSLFVGSVLLTKPLHVLFAHEHDHVCTTHTAHHADDGKHNCEICAFHFNPFIADETDIRIETPEIFLPEYSRFYTSVVLIAQKDSVSLRAPPVLFL